MSRIPDEPDSQIDVSDDSPDTTPAPPKVAVPDTASKTIPDRVYTREEKLKAAAVWVTNGTVKGTAEEIGVDREVMRRWVKARWWKPLVDEARQKFEDEITGNLSKIISAAQGKLMDRIEHGDEFPTKDGITTVPVKARDLAVIQAIAFDKRQIISGRPTAISRRSKTASEMADELRGKAAKPQRDGKAKDAKTLREMNEQAAPGNVVPFERKA